MTEYVRVADGEMEEPIEIPSEEDGTLLLSTVSGQFPGASGLKYRNLDTGSYRGIRLVDGNLHPPDVMWGSHVYVAVFPKNFALSENKRKGGDEIDNPIAKTKRLEKEKKCSDLIVLGLPWKSEEDDLRNYFGKFGELLLVQVKRDLKTGQSKGFGFIRYKDYESQIACMQGRHMIDGRHCDVTLPSSKGEGAPFMNRKIFIGRCTEDISADDLRKYFSEFGEVVDVFIPKPFRAFAFVTFAEPGIADSLCGDDHIIKGASVHISTATPKNADRREERKVGGYSQAPPSSSPGGYGASSGYYGNTQQSPSGYGNYGYSSYGYSGSSYGNSGYHY